MIHDERHSEDLHILLLHMNTKCIAEVSHIVIFPSREVCYFSLFGMKNYSSYQSYFPQKQERFFNEHRHQ